MNINYITDNLGNASAVVIPISEWKKINEKLDLATENFKNEFYSDIKSAVDEINLVLENKSVSRDALEFLNDL